MSTTIVHAQVRAVLDAHVADFLTASSRARLALLVSGLLEARSSRPAQIAAAIHKLGLSAAEPESIERQLRRTQSDPDLQARLCLDPLVRHHLQAAQARPLVVVLDPTCQDERVVLLMASVWYRGRTLPLAWVSWPANQPLTGARFWQRVAGLLAHVARLLPAGVPVTWVADRAFGTPAFTDQIAAYGWHWVVRVQGQTRYRDQAGQERPLQALVARPGDRAKGRGAVFKKYGWRTASVVAVWGARHRTPLLVVSDRPLQWELLAVYRQRASAEGTYRDYKSDGWEWERSQVTHLGHLERLWLGMALATWLVVWAGAQRAAEYLRRPPTGRRRTRPYAAKRSLFLLGLHAFRHYLPQLRLPDWHLPDWDAPNWSTQLTQRHAKAFVFHCTHPVRP
jgi:hypothetical protein